MTFCAQVIKRILHVKRVPQEHDIHNETECPKLVFLAFPIALAKFPFLPVKHLARDGMSPFPSIELDLNPAAKKLIISIGEQMQTLRDSSGLTDRSRQRRWTTSSPKRANER